MGKAHSKHVDHVPIRRKSEAGNLPGLSPLHTLGSRTAENSGPGVVAPIPEVAVSAAEVVVPASGTQEMQVTRPVMPRQITRLSNLVDPAELRESTMIKSPSGNLLGSEEYLSRTDRPLSVRERQKAIFDNMSKHNASSESLTTTSAKPFIKSPSKLSESSNDLAVERADAMDENNDNPNHDDKKDENDHAAIDAENAKAGSANSQLPVVSRGGMVGGGGKEGDILSLEEDDGDVCTCGRNIEFNIEAHVTSKPEPKRHKLRKLLCF